uniref:Aminotransferase-like plant mobile domain-containing protein n=1 Tax=Cucumis melo TaxID=3656 RepID=A0A9I9E2J8_CUCME
MVLLFFFVMDPGPVDDSHQYLQATHRSQSIWDTSSTVVLSCRKREAASQRTIPFDQRISPYLEAAGFLGLGLPVDGEPLTGSLRYNWMLICNDYLGVVPSDMKGQRLSLPWLAEQFEELPLDANIVSVQRYARAYIMQLIGGFLFADKSNTLAGTYAWDAATLAWLYRELCRASNAQSLEIAGPLMLLQINWTPYTPDIMISLPIRCQSGQAVWTYVGPLICFHLIEKHKPDRVLRQFNMLQTPPAISYTDQRLHQIDFKGKHDQDWRRIHAEHIGVWNSRY